MVQNFYNYNKFGRIVHSIATLFLFLNINIFLNFKIYYKKFKKKKAITNLDDSLKFLVFLNKPIKIALGYTLWCKNLNQNIYIFLFISNIVTYFKSNTRRKFINILFQLPYFLHASLPHCLFWNFEIN